MFGPISSKTRILLSLRGEAGGERPSQLSTCITLAIIVLFLAINERVCLWIIDTFVQGLHPVFDDRTNRRVLARHVGVDICGCAIVAYLGYTCRHLLSCIFVPGDADNVNFTSFLKLDSKRALTRVYSYVPEGHLILIYFTAYQIKNTHDSWIWNDGVLFMIHHAFALGAAWSGLYPGVAQTYAIFFMGMSEISTVFLCILGNFDSDFGVVGLGDAFPTSKLVVGLLFVITFIFFRVVLWPIFAYHFFNDMKIALEHDAAKLSLSSRVAMNFLYRSCQVLSVMQIVFLGQILLTVYTEISNMF